MSRKLADRRQDGGLVRWRDDDRAPGGGDGKGRAEMLPERLVRSRDRREQRALQHRLEPLDAYPRVAENAREVRFERGQIEERFVHVEDKDVFHDRRRGWDSNPRSFRLRTFEVRALGQLGDLSDYQQQPSRCPQRGLRLMLKAGGFARREQVPPRSSSRAERVGFEPTRLSPTAFRER